MFDQEFIERFEKNISKTNSCWLWIGNKDKDGYGVIKFHQKGLKAHRVSAVIYKHEKIEGYCVLHICDKPGCVNPKHLYLGTQKENANDRKQRKREGNLKGENNGRAKLTWNLVIEIRQKFKTGNSTKIALAKEFGITDTQIGKIIRGEAWKQEKVSYQFNNVN